jgi:hypothetical protein
MAWMHTAIDVMTLPGQEDSQGRKGMDGVQSSWFGRSVSQSINQSTN